MKRISFIGLLTVVLLAFAIGTSFASSQIYNGVNSGGSKWDDPVLNVQYAASEIIPTSGYTLAIDSPSLTGAETAGIAVKAGAQLNINMVVTFTLTNANFAALPNGYNYQLFVWNDALQQVEAVSGPASASGNQVSLTLTKTIYGPTIPGGSDGDVFALLGATQVNNPGSPMNNWDIIRDFGLTTTGGQMPQNVMVALTTPVAEADAAATTIQIYDYQFAVQPKSWRNLGEIGIDYIDASKWVNRKLFRHHTQWADDTAFQLSQDVTGYSAIAHSSEIESVSLVLSGDFSGIDDPQEDVILPFDESLTPWHGTWDPVTQTLTFFFDDEPHIRNLVWGFGASHHLIFHVDGSTQLNTRAWYMSATIEMKSPINQTNTYQQQVIGEWQVNGKQFLLPLTRYTIDDINRTFIKFVNDNAKAATVFCDVIYDGGIQNGYVYSVNMGEIPAHQNWTYTGLDINAALLAQGYPDPSAFSGNFTTRWTLTTTENDEIDNAGSKIYGTAWFNVYTGVNWGTRTLDMYEDVPLQQRVHIWGHVSQNGHFEGGGFSEGTQRTK